VTAQTITTHDELRLFVAVLVPSDAADAIARALDPWRPRVPEARWVAAADRHVTVRFLGPTPRGEVPWICERLSRVAAACPGFRTRVSGLGTFPGSRRKARVLWAGLDDPMHGFTCISSEAARALGERFPNESRAYTPHITLARSARPIRLAPALLETPVASPSFAVEEISLMRGRVEADRSNTRYERMRSFRLASGS
jgi:RNA 2',3'-cyclic 3'-phosphodiesterase